ncbi:MAG TPA: hypothetical protein VG405_06270 [Solirubrobacteraceae bacterium]|nr:hypothetical protein [Solirubrobacteraceae bacterium]
MQSILRRRPVLVILALGASLLIAACGGSGGKSGSSSAANASASTGGVGAYGGGSGSSQPASTSTSTSGPTVKLANTSRGKLLVDSRGFTLYLFTKDTHNVNSCVKVTGCTAAWPALTVTGQPSAGSGVSKSLLGTIKLPNGREQVTYAGHPLYGYTGDSRPGSTSYIGATSFGGAWPAANAAGKPVG